MIKRKFWRGPKRLAKKYYPGRVWNYFETHGLPEPGDLTHDCDGFNHVIKTITWKWYPVRILKKTKNGFKYKTLGLSILLPEIIYQDRPDYSEHYVCACGGIEFQIPLTAKQISDYFVSWPSTWATIIDEEYSLGLVAFGNSFRKNIPVIDARGVLLKK